MIKNFFNRWILVGLFISVILSIILWFSGMKPTPSFLVSLIGTIITFQTDLILRFENSRFLQEQSNILLAENDENLDKYRRLFHFYYQTRENDEVQWCYIPINFKAYYRYRYLYTVCQVARPSTMQDDKPQAFEYKIFGYIQQGQLILIKFGQRETQEVDVILFPYFCDIQPVTFGSCSHIDWDTKWSSEPALISEKIQHDPEGVDDSGWLKANTATDLAKRWKENQKYDIRLPEESNNTQIDSSKKTT